MPISNFTDEFNREYLEKGWLFFHISTPMGPHGNEKEKEIVKVQNCEKRKILSGDMVNTYLSTTFGVNSHDVSEKTRFTDGRRTPTPWH